MKIQQPTVGRIVFLTGASPRALFAIHRPAIVTFAVQGMHEVNLFTPNRAAAGAHPTRRRARRMMFGLGAGRC
jgi:hypothetical protein